MNNFDFNSIIDLDKNQIDFYFSTRLKNSYDQKQVEFIRPSAEEIIQAVPMETLFIPWKDLSDGLRLSKLNDYQPRVVQVQQRRATWSTRLKKDNYKSIIDQLFHFIERNLADIYRYKFLEESNPSLDMQACTALLQRLFLNQEPFRLMPKINLPDQKICLEVFNKYFPEPEFKVSYYSNEFLIQKSVGGFQFLEIGERGGIEKQFESEDLQEVQFVAFKNMSSIDYVVEDRQFVFDYNQIYHLKEFREKD